MKGSWLHWFPCSCQMPPTPCVCLLLNIFARGRWLTEPGLGQGQSTWQVRSSLITDALLRFNLYVSHHLILIPPENIDKLFLPSAGQCRQLISCKAKLPQRDAKIPLMIEACSRHRPRPTQSNSRHLPLSREQQQLCPTFSEPVVKGCCRQEASGQ